MEKLVAIVVVSILFVFSLGKFFASRKKNKSKNEEVMKIEKTLLSMAMAKKGNGEKENLGGPRFFPKNLWMISFGVDAIISIMTALLLKWAVGFTNIEALEKFPVGILAVVIFIGLVFHALWLGFTPLSENHNRLVELFGNYTYTATEGGWYFFFPYFGWVTTVLGFMGQRRKNLFRYIDNAGVEQVVLIDFKNASVPIYADVFFKVNSLYRAVYCQEDSIKATIRYLESFVRAVIPEEMEEAMKKKGNDLSEQFITSPENEELLKLGIKVQTVKVYDFVLTESQRNALNSVLEASKKSEAAAHEANAIAKRAEGQGAANERLAKAERIAIEEKAMGIAELVSMLDIKGIKGERAIRHLEEMEKWGNPNIDHIVGEGGSNHAFNGAAQGTGFRHGYHRRDQGDYRNREQSKQPTTGK